MDFTAIFALTTYDICVYAHIYGYMCECICMFVYMYLFVGAMVAIFKRFLKDI